MSNLKLPNMSRENLMRLVGNKSSVKLAYETTAESIPGGVRVRHHGNNIAELTEERTWLSNAGWDSQTTASRLDKIAHANNIPVRIAVRQRAMVILDPDTLKIAEPFYSASWVQGVRQH